jgi:hypothetical protein
MILDLTRININYTQDELVIFNIYLHIFSLSLSILSLLIKLCEKYKSAIEITIYLKSKFYYL